MGDNLTVIRFWRRHPRAEPPVYKTDVFSSDSALTDLAADEFGRADFARRIAGVIQDRKGSAAFVIGIFGAWGSGKTTALHFVEATLNAVDVEKFPVVWFNPWRYGREDVLVQGLFDTLADAILTSLPTARDKIGAWLERAGGAAGGLSLSGSGIEAGVGSGLAAAGRLLSQRSLETDRTRLNAALRESGKRVVVMIDDIDRLDKNEIVAVLRAVRLSADLDNLVYILAFDRTKVAAALAERYPGQSGSDFLDKMVQLPLPLPPADPSIVRERLLRDVDELLARHGTGPVPLDRWRLVSTFDAAVLPRVRTARDHTLYLNAAEFAVPAHRGELNVTDILLLEALRLFYPGAYAAVARQREVILHHALGGEEALSMLLETVSEVSSGDGPQPLRRLLRELFPQFDTVLTSSFHTPVDVARWAAERRVCSDRYFDRYFSYGLPAGDVADRSIDELVGSVDPEPLLRSLLAEARPGIVIAKLHDRVDSVPAELAIGLLEAIGETAQTLPALTSDRDLSSPRARASVLAVRLLSRVPARLRAEAAMQLLSRSHVEFAVLVLNWLLASADSADAPLTAEIVTELRMMFARRLLDIDQDSPLADIRSALVPRMYALAFEHDKERARLQLADAMTDRRRLGSLLRRFIPSGLPTAGSSATGLADTIGRQAISHMGQALPIDILLAAAQSSTPLAGEPVIERFVELAAGGAASTEIDLPAVTSVYPHPLANYGPPALGGAEPHDPDFAVRVAALIPDTASSPHSPLTPVSQLVGLQRESELVRLLTKHPITAWLSQNMSAFGATHMRPWEVSGLRGDDVTTLTAELVDADERMPVRATATFSTGTSQGSAPGPCLLALLDVSFALLDRDSSRHRTDARNDATPGPAPAALKLAELAHLLHASFGTFDIAWQATQRLLPTVRPRAAIGIWLASRNGLDRVIDTSHLRVLGKTSSSQENLVLHRQLAPPALGEPTIEQLDPPNLAIATVAHLLKGMNCRGFEAELFVIRATLSQTSDSV